jgi:phosphoglycolate phosphatase-like HAD superfamily hydrolase
MRKLILFDIDGTLLWSRGAAKRAFLRAMIEVYGTAGPIATHPFGGKTDPQIARELLQLEGFADAAIDDGFVRLWEMYVDGLRTELQKHAAETMVLPGVRELISALEQRADALFGLLTGNIEAGAALKLEAAGLHGRFRFGAFGSDHERREALPPIAVERARRHAGRDFRGRDIVIIGDTPADMTCGRALDVHALGVTTGHFDAASLNAAGAQAVFADLTDTEAVLEALLS